MASCREEIAPTVYHKKSTYMNVKRFSIVALLMLLVSQVWAQPNAPEIVVSKDGKGNFTSIQEAVMSVRDYKPERTTIYVKNGVYEEKILIPANKCDITIIGQSQEGVVITHGDYAKLNNMGTFKTWTLRVDGDGIRIENLTIENSAGPVGQAVALHVEGDRCEFAHVRLLGNQDTMFNGGNGTRQYFKDCYIEGTTDFLFGPATVLLDSCQIHCKANSYITAASTPQNVAYGYVFRRCRVTADEGLTKVYLGRPWRAFASVTWIDCELPSCILPEGWHNWGRTENEQTARYSEFASTGDGANVDGRVKWAKVSAETANVNIAKLFFSTSKWTPAYAPAEKSHCSGDCKNCKKHKMSAPDEKVDSASVASPKPHSRKRGK